MQNSVHTQQAQLAEQFADAQPAAPGIFGHPAASQDNTPDLSALRHLLAALGWRGEERHLMEALPHFDTIRDLAEFRAVLARLNYETQRKSIGPANLTNEILPCLLSLDNGDVLVILQRDGAQLKTVSLNTQAVGMSAADSLAGTVHLVTPVDIDRQYDEINKYGWLGMVTRKFRRLMLQLLAITFITNFFALAVPIYVMNVYDKVVATKSLNTMIYFFAGIVIVVAADVSLRLIRGRALAYLGTRYDAILGAAAFQQILHLPIGMTETVPIGSQVSRLKQFEGIREIFTGSLANAVLDLPFMLIFLTAIIIFGGAVAWVPIALIVLYALMAAITIPITKRHVSLAGETRAKSQNFLIELVTKHAVLRESRAEKIWMERYRTIASNSTLGNFRSQQFGHAVQTLAQSMVTIAGVATLGIGTLRVMDGDMTLGALIAVMAMVWRVLAPIQAAFLSLNRISQVAASFRQINHLMRLRPEREPGILPSFYRDFKGSISVKRLSFRHNPRSEPALMGLSLDIPPGQLVGVTGPSGAGKSTLLKIIAGLYPVQAGAVQMDGLDLRQIDVGELRHAIGYVPQEATFFYGTVAQNIRLAHPEATDEAIKRAVCDAGMFDYDELLPEGMETRLTNELQKRLPDSVKQRLMLARAYTKEAPVYLMDEPASALDRAGDQALCAKLQQLQGKATIIMVTHRPSHMRMCDRLLYLEHGQLIHDGKPDQVLPIIMPS